ncbi:MAG: ATP-binding protein [Planctomyces sp.]|nr:ATP-binding protein [Planctomyces sp.]
MRELGWVLLGLAIGAACVGGLAFWKRWRRQPREMSVADMLKRHFGESPCDQLAVSERSFPYRVRADLQRAVNACFGEQCDILQFFGVRREYSHQSLSFSDGFIHSQHSPMLAVPPEYEELDIGDDEPIRVLKQGLWLMEREGVRLAVLLVPAGKYGQVTGMQVQVAVQGTDAGLRASQELFRRVEQLVEDCASYRGKILSLELSDHSYSGESSGIRVHKLRLVERDQIILPEATLELLERNVIRFVQQRKRLGEYGQSTRKGLLFYGPPGTGKTHTIHFLARELPGHTTLLISAEQVALLDEYMTLARLLQPSVIVIEDVDLIARDRSSMSSACEEVLLNKLLNEMDGLRPDAEILFLLTTNRPEALEAALASRPGRIDQAIEFPLPDEEGRLRLIRLYGEQLTIAEALLAEIARRTEGVSAAFIKELMRRIVQFHLENDGAGEVSEIDVDMALDEMLFRGGSLNLQLLGGGGCQFGFAAK